MASWIDDFEGNKLNPKWVATRLSTGGQNNGVWTREVKDSKIYWNGVNVGTETGFWGETLSLPVNATGDIIVEALIRQKRTAGTTTVFGVGVNQSIITAETLNGVEIIWPGIGANWMYGRRTGATTTWPGMPSKTYQAFGQDDIKRIRIVRKNGVLFLYGDSQFVGQGTYAPTITTVDISANWYQAQTGAEKWVDYIKVWPSSVVL